MLRVCFYVYASLCRLPNNLAWFFVFFAIVRVSFSYNASFLDYPSLSDRLFLSGLRLFSFILRFSFPLSASLFFSAYFQLFDFLSLFFPSFSTFLFPLASVVRFPFYLLSVFLSLPFFRSSSVVCSPVSFLSSFCLLFIVRCFISLLSGFLAPPGFLHPSFLLSPLSDYHFLLFPLTGNVSPFPPIS